MSQHAALAAWWGRVTVSHPVAVESAGLISVQLLCFWLPGLVDFLLHWARPAAADGARLQRGKLPSMAEWAHCARVVLRNSLASEALHWTYLGMKGWQPTTRVAGVRAARARSAPARARRPGACCCGRRARGAHR